ncbi:kinase-like protein [Schizopora paradoxa]|uniref:Kinase-like protein n=1 Tax=Schizopora paradoxa TaxID=27342 RepID=A0A0H2RAQ6_9AGAM|nr:kinase-like protein [Schizopora paradoxa]
MEVFCDATTRLDLHNLLDEEEDVILISNSRNERPDLEEKKGWSGNEHGIPLTGITARTTTRRASLPLSKRKSVLNRPPTPFTRDKRKRTHAPKSLSVDFAVSKLNEIYTNEAVVDFLCYEPTQIPETSEQNTLPVLEPRTDEQQYSSDLDDDAQSEITLIDFYEPLSDVQDDVRRDALDGIVGLLNLPGEDSFILENDGDMTETAGMSIRIVDPQEHDASADEGIRPLQEDELPSSSSDFDTIIFAEWRNVALRSIEGLFEDMLPLSLQTSHWPEVRARMKVYPLSFHFALQVLEHTTNWAVEPLLRRTINGVDQSLLFEILEDFAQMSTIRAVANHGKARALVVDVLGHIELISATVRNPGDKFSNYGKVIREAMIHDVIDLKRSVTVLLDSGEAFINATSKLPEDELQSFMELMQTLIDQRETSPSCRLIERALRKIVNRTGILPKYLFQHEAKRQGRNPIAGGGFADVWLGQLHGKLVALKVLRHFEQSEDARMRRHQSFCKEAMIWRQFDHPNVLPFYGVCVNEFSPQSAMVAPWMQYGNILKYLTHHSDVNRIEMITGIARGLSYLHSLLPHVIHGDLRASNVLVDDEGQPRVADFGLSQMVDSQGLSGMSSMGGKGSVRWQAPELLNVGQSFEDVSCTSPTTKSDTYAFAMVCLEIYTEEPPFPRLRDGQVILEVAVNRKRPERPTFEDHLPHRRLSDGLWMLMQECWQHYASDRPSMESALLWLESLQSNADGRASVAGHHRYGSRSPPYGLARVDVLHVPGRIVVLPPIDFLRQRRSTVVE